MNFEKFKKLDTEEQKDIVMSDEHFIEGLMYFWELYCKIDDIDEMLKEADKILHDRSCPGVYEELIGNNLLYAVETRKKIADYFQNVKNTLISISKARGTYPSIFEEKD